MDRSILRLSPFGPDEHPPAPKRGRPAAPELVETVRRLIETTSLSYRVIAARTGMPIASISRHAAKRGWYRPEPEMREERLTPEGRRRQWRGELAGRILRRAETLMTTTEMDPSASAAALARAAKLVRLAESLEAAASTRRRRRKRRRSSVPPNR